MNRVYATLARRDVILLQFAAPPEYCAPVVSRAVDMQWRERKERTRDKGTAFYHASLRASIKNCRQEGILGLSIETIYESSMLFRSSRRGIERTQFRLAGRRDKRSSFLGQYLFQGQICIALSERNAINTSNRHATHTTVARSLLFLILFSPFSFRKSHRESRETRRFNISVLRTRDFT